MMWFLNRMANDSNNEENQFGRSFGSPNADDSTTVFPLSRIRMIMKSSPDTTNVGQDGLFVMTKAVVSFPKSIREHRK